MKKIKKILILFFAIISVSAINAQSKQETIDWINQKIESCLNRNFSSLSGVNEKLKILQKSGTLITLENTKTYEDNEFKKISDVSVTKIDLSKIFAVRISDNFSTQNGIITLQGYNGFISNSLNGEKFVDENEYQLYFKKVGYFSLFNLNCEPNFQERMITAFEKLAEYNKTQKPKEAF